MSVLVPSFLFQELGGGGGGGGAMRLERLSPLLPPEEDPLPGGGGGGGPGGGGTPDGGGGTGAAPEPQPFDPPETENDSVNTIFKLQCSTTCTTLVCRTFPLDDNFRSRYHY